MRELIKEILIDLRPDVDFDKEDRLVSDGILDSFDIVSLVSELFEEFNVEIKANMLVAENFNSIDSIVALVEKLK